MWEEFPNCNLRERALHARSLQETQLTHSEGSIPYLLADKINETCVSGGGALQGLLNEVSHMTLSISDELTPEGCAELHNLAVQFTLAY